VYFGIVPAALVRGHDPGTDTAMHEATGRAAESHHVMVAVFDVASGARFIATRVNGTLRTAGGAPVSRPLEPMTVNGALTYGNYFSIPEDGTPSTFEARIDRPDAPATVVTFTYRHAP